jgi:5-(carboxyamino)imidazole ribonucleotide synthase
MTSFPLPPNATIGLVGGGQLGRMSALAAARLGYRCHILTRETDSPAAQVSHAVTLSDYSDPVSLRAFADAVDVISFEFENVSAEGLDLLASLRPVRPAPAVLRISQDRIHEKSFLNNAGVATAPWAEVTTRHELDAAVARLGLPSVLKTTRLGYDGKGQSMLRTPQDLDAAWERLTPKPLVLEGFIDFAQEISVIVARGTDGAMASFDTVENRHRNHILDITLTIDACPASQFELHIRAIAGLPLPPATRHADAVMKNLIGPEGMALWPAALAEPGIIPHLYGKAEALPGRKMGHVTRLFPRGALPGEFGVTAALGPLAEG